MNNLQDRLKHLLDLARQAPPSRPGDPAPPFLAGKVIRQWRKQTQASHPRPFAWRVAALAATGLLVLALGWMILFLPGNGSHLQYGTAPPVSSTDDLRDLALLVTEPPVAPMHPAQSAWLSVLVELSERNSNEIRNP